MQIISRIALIILVIGGLNWGLVGLFQFDLVAAIVGGQAAPLARIIYILVGVSALVSLPLLRPARGRGATTDSQGYSTR